MTKTNNMNFKKVFNNLQSILIVILVIIILLMRNCSGGKTSIPKPPKPKTETKIEYVTIEKEVPVYVPRWKEKEVPKYIPYPIPTDTAAILFEYYAQYKYSDTLSLDTIGYVVVNDVISKNKIESRSYLQKITIPVKTITITDIVYENKRELYYGLGVSGNKNQLNYVGAELMYRNKKKQAYGLGVGINQNLQPVLSGRIYWKIGK